MRKVIWILAIGMLSSCGSSQMAETKTVQTQGPAPEEIKMAVAEETTDVKSQTDSEGTFTNAERVKDIMDYLASDDLKGRNPGTEGIEKAAVYIENHLKSYQVKPYFNTYRDTLSNFKKTTYNVLGLVEGNDPVLKKEYIMIGAHYDHLGIIKIENGDAIANGANDNASGTTTVLELARYFGTKKTNKRSLIFALFSAEEKGLLGSKHLAKKLKDLDLNLYAMLNFEMTGVPMRGKDHLTYITGYKKSNLAEVSNLHAKENLVGYLPTSREYGLFQRSDNYPFFQEFGIPAHTYCTFDFTNFMHYHRVSDENDLLDFEHMATLINKMVPVVEGISNANEQEVKMY